MNPLRFGADASESELRLAIVEAGRIAYERELLVSSDGNISVRMGDHRVIITPSALCKGRLEERDLLVLDLDGQVVKPAVDESLLASSETPMHLAVYRQRPDVRAVIHAHPAYATALTVADKAIPSDVLPEVLLTLGEVVTSSYATPSSEEDAAAIQDLVLDHDAILLRNHGSVNIGANLDEALISLERLENVAKIITLAHLLGGLTRLKGADMQKLRQIRAAMEAGGPAERRATRGES